MGKNLLILGARGHGRVVKETAEAMGVFVEIGFLDDNPESKVALGLCSDYEKYAGEYPYAFPAFGNNELRMKWMERLQEKGFTILVLIHPTAFISPSAAVHPGTIIGAKAIINTNSVIERGSIVSVGAIVDHDAHVGRGCHIDCGATVKANCVVNDFTKLASGKVYEGDDLSAARVS